MDRGHSRLYPFDPDSGRLPEIAAPGALLSGAGRGVVTLIVAPDVIRSSWSPTAAVALARAWSGQGHRVVLCDLSLTWPVLHETLGLPNAVGIVDVVLREAPIPSVAQRAGTPGFQFISVGTPIEDPTEVTLSDEWAAFVEEVGDAQATIVFYVPADLPGVDALVARSAATLLLAGDPTEAEWVAQSFALDDVAGLVEDRGEEGAQAAEPPEAPQQPAVDDFGSIADSSAVADVHEETETTGEEPNPEPRVILWRPALAGTLVGLGALALWQVMFTASEPVPPLVEATAPQPPVSSAPSTSPAGPHQVYSLALAAYQAGETARRQAQRMARRRPDLLFIVAPVRVSGRVYHRVLAGPVEDSLGAERLRASLAETLSDENAARWIVRPTPLAYGFGEFESSEAAQVRVAEVRNAGIGAYILEVGGMQRPLFRVYAGAYQSPAEAEVMGAALNALPGSASELERRIGRYVR